MILVFSCSYDWTWRLPSSQVVPPKPETQLQVYMLTSSTHVAPFIHGLLSHSLISAKIKTFRKVKGISCECCIESLVLLENFQLNYPTCPVKHYLDVDNNAVGIAHRIFGHTNSERTVINKRVN